MANTADLLVNIAVRKVNIEDSSVNIAVTMENTKKIFSNFLPKKFL